MDGGAWHAIVHYVSRVRHDSVTKPSPPPRDKAVNMIRLRNDQDFEISDKHLKITMTNIFKSQEEEIEMGHFNREMKTIRKSKENVEMKNHSNRDGKSLLHTQQ